jgi:dTDP-4-dehydrorhamnose 3,5-epimerase
VVPSGAVKFVLFDDRENSDSRGQFFEITLSPENYFRLTIPPEIWMGFTGITSGLNLILNIANLEHDPDEVLRKEVATIPYPW